MRFHGILDDDTSLVQNDCASYSFYNVDTIYDYILSIGMLPLVELSFTPNCMASGPPYIFHYNGNGHPPKDYNQWYDFIKAVVGHWHDRYGAETLRKFYFEVYNEPNCGFFNGTQAEYFKFYNYTATAVKSVDPSLRVGGPATCQLGWLPDLISYVTANDVPLDFASTHLYPTDPNVPLNDRFGFSNAIKGACAQVPRDVPVLITEYNAGLYQETLDKPYAASFVWHNLPLLAEINNLPLWSYWQATGIFEEGGQSSVEFDSNDFGIQTLHGVPKPVYRGLQLLNRASVTGVQATQTPSAATSTVTSFAALDSQGSNVLVYLTNFDVIENGPMLQNVTVMVTVSHAAGFSKVGASVDIVFLDDHHSNPRTAWLQMGSPMYPTPSQVNTLKAASELVWLSCEVTARTATSVSFAVPLGKWASAMLVVPYNN